MSNKLYTKSKVNMKIFDIIVKISNFWGYIVLLYLVCFTFLLISEYKSNPEFADSIICEEIKDYQNYNYTSEHELFGERKDCEYIKEMNRKGTNLFYLGMIFFIIRFISEVIWPNKDSIVKWSEELDKEKK